MSIRPLLHAVQDYLTMNVGEEVRCWFDGFDWNLSERNLAPHGLPAARHLESVNAHIGRGEQALVATLLNLQDKLCWGQTYGPEDFGQHFVDNYGWVEVFGTRGHFACDDMAGGFVLFGPGLDYPPHWHVAEEIYFPLTSGARWMQDEGPYVERRSGEFIFHESNESHGLKTGEAPLLALYVWRGGDLTQKSNY